MPSTFSVRRALAVLVAVCVCVSATAGTAAASAARTDDAATGCFPRVDSVDRGDAVGDVVEIETLLCFEGSVTVDGPGYRGNATLGETDASGTVTLELHTDRRGASVFAVTSDTIESVPMNATGDGAFEPGNYTVTVRDGSGDVADTVSFVVDAPSGDVTLWRAPLGSQQALRTVATVRESRQTASNGDSKRGLDDSAADQLSVATNETVVVELRADGLADAMAGADGDPRTRLRTALRETDREFEFLQTAESTPPQRQPLTPPVLNSTATRVVSDPTNDTYYVVVDTGDLYGTWGGTHGGDVHVGSRSGIGFGARLLYHGSATDDPPNATAAADFEIVDAAVSTPATVGERTVLTPDANATFVARTTLAPGTSVTVDLSGVANRTVDAEVRARNDSGNVVVAPLDLSGVADGATLAVRVERNGTALDEGRLTAVVAEPAVTLSVEPDAAEDGRLAVLLSDATHPTVVASTAANGTVVDTAAVAPAATNDTTESVTLDAADSVVLYHDADRSKSLTAGDERYRQRDVDRETTDSTTDSTTTSATRPATQTSTPDGTGAGTPGFGVLAAAAAFFVAVGLRRR